MARPFVNKASAADRPQYKKVLERIIKEGVCPFCEQYFLKYHTRPILKKGRHWIVTENMNPYAGTSRHILFVHRGHIEDTRNLKPQAAAELARLAHWIQAKYKLPGASLFMRMGDIRYTGASVRHLHANLLSGVRQSLKTVPIAVTLGHKRR